MPLRRILLIAVALFLTASPVYAQTIPIGGNNYGNTITTTNTFQTIQTDNGGRKGCTIQNQTSDSMWVFFCPPGTCNGTCTGASKTSGKSVLLSTQGQSVNCANGSGYTLYGEVCITGTSGDAFFANFQ